MSALRDREDGHTSAPAQSGAGTGLDGGPPAGETGRAAADEQEQLLRLLSVGQLGGRAGFWDWDIPSGRLTWTPEFRELFGLPPDAPASFETWRAVVHPDDIVAAEERIGAAVDAQETLDNEYRLVRTGGDIVWIRAQGLVERDRDGAPLRMTGICVDITDRVRAEQALRAEEAHMRVALDAAGFGVWRRDVLTGVVTLDERCREQYGFEQDAVTFEEALSRVHPDDLEALRGTLAAALDPCVDQDDCVVEYRVVPPGRPMRWLSVGVRVVFEGEGAGRRAVMVLGASQDITERMTAAQSLGEREQAYSAIFQGSPFAIALMTREGAVVDGNQAFFDMLAASRAEVVGRSVVDLGIVDEAETGRIAGILERDGAVRDLELARTRPDGEPLAVSLSLSPVTISGREYVLATYRDITERMRAERDLAESELKFRSLFEHTSIGVFLTAPSGDIEAANPAAQAMFGYTEEEFRRLGRAGVLDASDPRLAAALEERDLTGRVQAVELTAVRKDGERFPVEIDSTILSGPPPRSFVLMRDIGWRKQAERALEAREAEAREMLERLSRAQALGHMGDWAWDVASGQVSWSPEVYRVFGFAPDAETTFDSIVPFVHEDDRATHMRRVERLAADPAQTSGTFSFRIVRPDGEVRDINQTVVVERDAHGVAVRMYGLIQDVTELRRAEQALVRSEARLRRVNLELEDRVEQRTEQLRKANEELESFSYSVSHDLRAPLRHVSGYSQLLAEQLGGDLDDEARHFLEVIVASAREMDQLIDDLLKLSRLGRAELHVGVVDMAGCVREALDVLRADPAAHASVRIGDLPEVIGDRALLRQVWVNLLENAFKYSAPREAPEVEVGAREEDGETVFFVRDNGVGFDMAYAGKLFSVFERLHSSAEFEGTGIGLATVRRLVERHGGRVWAQAAPDEGATFCFTVPADGGGLS